MLPFFPFGSKGNICIHFRRTWRKAIVKISVGSRQRNYFYHGMLDSNTKQRVCLPTHYLPPDHHHHYISHSVWYPVDDVFDTFESVPWRVWFWCRWSGCWGGSLWSEGWTLQIVIIPSLLPLGCDGYDEYLIYVLHLYLPPTFSLMPIYLSPSI